MKSIKFVLILLAVISTPFQQALAKKETVFQILCPIQPNPIAHVLYRKAPVAIMINSIPKIFFARTDKHGEIRLDLEQYRGLKFQIYPVVNGHDLLAGCSSLDDQTLQSHNLVRINHSGNIDCGEIKRCNDPYPEASR